MNFNQRSSQKELLDQDNIPKADLWQNLYELERINQLLGGHAATIKGLKHFIKDKNYTYKIVDFGCGGGDSLTVIAQWAKKNHFKVSLTGIDLLPDAIEYAQKNNAGANINYLQANILHLPQTEEYDIAISSLFCHHLYGDDLHAILLKKLEISKLGFLINDLHRHPLAYYSIKYLSKFFSKSYLVKNDAPLSVARGYTKVELEQELKKLPIKAPIIIKWIWAFRYLTILDKRDAK